MRPAGREHDVSLRRETLEPGIAINVQHAFEAFKMGQRTLGFAVGREQIDRRWRCRPAPSALFAGIDRSEEHTSELQSLMRISYAVFCLKKTQKQKTNYT